MSFLSDCSGRESIVLALKNGHKLRFLEFSLWLLIDADLGSSEKTVANLPASLHHVAHRILILIGDTLLNHELGVVDVRVKLLIDWVELDDIELGEGFIHYPRCHLLSLNHVLKLRFQQFNVFDFFHLIHINMLQSKS